MVAHFLTVLLPAYYRALAPSKAAWIKALSQLSARVERLTAQLPAESETVRNLFDPTGSSRTGPQLR